MLTNSDITYVNFTESCYVSHTPGNSDELDALADNGFVPVDYAIADIIMRLNSISGCETVACCSGHPGKYSNGYINFRKISDNVLTHMNACHHWFRDSEVRLTWRMAPIDHRIHNMDWHEWMKALMELGNAGWLPNNKFTHYSWIHSSHSKYGNSCIIAPENVWNKRSRLDFIHTVAYGRTEVDWNDDANDEVVNAG
jgi:hypothetical protein